jgi:NAD(P)-dependent dehydrogenase (short-subunit alcohol dehydrogenase family)
MAESKVAIVTGAGRGMGRSMALGLAANGWTVIGTAARNTHELAALAERAGGAIEIRQADVSDSDACAALVRDVLAHHGRIDALVNNAGRGMLYVSDRFMETPTKFWETDPATWRMVIETNVNGPFYMARAVVPSMLKAGFGRIVNVSMNKETMKRPGFTPYGPSKAALDSETTIWAGELSGTGITVNSLLPGGATDTGMIPPGTPSEMRASFLEPEVMVPPLLWLLSEAGASTSGRRIVARLWDKAHPEASMEEPIII